METYFSAHRIGHSTKSHFAHYCAEALQKRLRRESLLDATDFFFFDDLKPMVILSGKSAWSIHLLPSLTAKR